MKNFKDIRGLHYGRLLAISRIGKTSLGKTLWLCQCDCGRVTTATLNALCSGNTKSCGCLKTEAVAAHAANRRAIGFGVHHERARNTWKSMLSRCEDEMNSSYPDYGGRGIKVCPSWHDLKAFVRDMGDPPHGKTLDRKDPNGNYEPGNCRWATAKEQARNTRKTRYGYLGDERLSFNEMADRLGTTVLALKRQEYKALKEVELRYRTTP